MKMFFGNKNLIKSLLIVILTSSLPINNAKANIFDRIMGNPFSGKWCITRLVHIEWGERKFGPSKRNAFCLTFKDDNVVIFLIEKETENSKYVVLDNKTAWITLPDRGYKRFLKFNRNTQEMSFSMEMQGGSPTLTFGKPLIPIDEEGDTTFYLKNTVFW